MEYINGKVGIGMKESGNNASNMEMEQIYLLTEILIKEISEKEKLTVKDNTLGRMDLYMLESSEMVSKVEKEGGNQAEKSLILTNMKEIIWLIKSMALVFSSGLVETLTRASTLRMRGMETVK